MNRLVVTMAQMGRPGLSVSAKRELWQRWRAGESLSNIGIALERHAGSIHGVLSLRGGISPPERSRSPNQLSLPEREEISRGIATGSSIRLIAMAINRAPSTVSREITRNGGRTRYRAAKADEAAWDRSRRPKPCKLATNEQLRSLVAQKLRLDWSPEQISGWLMLHYPDDDQMRISHESIYRSLFIQARGVLKKELLAHLRSRRMMRRSKLSTTKGQPRGRIVDGVSISERPAEVEDRAVPGHWEGDLIDPDLGQRVIQGGGDRCFPR